MQSGNGESVRKGRSGKWVLIHLQEDLSPIIFIRGKCVLTCLSWTMWLRWFFFCFNLAMIHCICMLSTYLSECLN